MFGYMVWIKSICDWKVLKVTGMLCGYNKDTAVKGCLFRNMPSMDCGQGEKSCTFPPGFQRPT